MPNFRIGHITDLHARRTMPGHSAMAVRRSRNAFQLLPRALKDMRDTGVQFVAVTGDLLDVPDYIVRGDDYYDYHAEQWKADAVADYRALKDIFENSGMPYMVLPGNHDFEPAMWNVFDRDANAVDLQGHRILRFCDREHDGHIPRRVDRERKLWEHATRGDSPAPQIHLQHYVITPELNQGYPHTYLEGEHLRRGIAACGRVKLSLSGHYHSGTDLLRHGATHFTTGEAFCDFPHHYRIYEINDGDVSVQKRQLLTQPVEASRPAAFIDRDGVVSTLASYDSGPAEMKLVPGSAQAIAKLRNAGYAPVIITNQAAVGLGYVTPLTVAAVNDHMCRLLRDEAGEGAQPDAILYSFGSGDAVHAHYADVSECKPSPALLQKAAQLFQLDMRRAFMVGDRDTDVETAWNAGLPAVLVRTGDGRITEQKLRDGGPVTVYADLNAAAEELARRIQ